MDNEAAKPDAEDPYDEDCGISAVSSLQNKPAATAAQNKEEVKREEDSEDESAITASQPNAGDEDQ